MSIESLKKSAKKLHRALQEGPNLTLMQVQHHLAQSHGYKSWDEALTGPPKEFNDQDLHVTMAETGPTRVFVGGTQLGLLQELTVRAHVGSGVPFVEYYRNGNSRRSI